MRDSTIWELLNQLGVIQPLWWYTIAVIPLSLLAVAVYLLVWFTLARRRERLIAMLFWLVIASLPILMTLPSLFASLAIGSALGYLGITRPAAPQDIAFATAQRVGTYLEQIAWLGVAGAVLTIIVLVTALLRSGIRYTPPSQRRTEDPNARTQQPPTQAYSGVITATFERRPNPRVSAPYGVIRVISGQRKGTHFGITGNMLIGSHKANLTINDRIVSGRHALLDVRDSAVYLSDEGSRNGTYLRRNSKIKDVLPGHPVLLEPNDVIILGNPDLAEAVQMIYERATLADDSDQGSEIAPDEQEYASDMPSISSDAA